MTSVSFPSPEDGLLSDPWNQPYVSTTQPAAISITPLLQLRLEAPSVRDSSNTMVPSVEHGYPALPYNLGDLSILYWASNVTQSPITMAMLPAFAGCRSLQYLTAPIDSRVAAPDDLSFNPRTTIQLFVESDHITGVEENCGRKPSEWRLQV